MPLPKAEEIWYMGTRGNPKDCSCGLRYEISFGLDPKYRKWIERKDIGGRVEEIFLEIAERDGFEILLAYFTEAGRGI